MKRRDGQRKVTANNRMALLFILSLYVVYHLPFLVPSFLHVLHPFKRQRIERMRVNREKETLAILDEKGKDIDRKIKRDR